MLVLSHPVKMGNIEGRDKEVDHNTLSSVSKPKFPSKDGVFTKLRGEAGIAGRPVRRWLK